MKRRVKVAHYSGQWSDPDRTQKVSAQRICARAQSEGYLWVTGTEAGGQSEFARFLAEAAPAHGLEFHKLRGDVWILTARSLFRVKPSAVWYPVIQAQAGRSEGRGVLRVTGHTSDMGTITILAAHFLTHGKPGDRDKSRVSDNDRLAKKIGALGDVFGRGGKLCFYGGDQNFDDRRHDTFRGGPFTSLWDELGHYEPTTEDRAVLDVIASYNDDKRVTGFDCHALDDSEFPTPVDHFLVEGEFDITLTRKKER